MTIQDSEMGLFEAMYTQRAIRRFRPAPVPEAIVVKLIEAATKAPSGGNRQPWSFIAVRGSDAKRRIGEYYLRSWEAAYGAQADPPPAISDRVRSSAAYLAEHMEEVPVLVFACIGHDGSPGTTTRGSSIYPAVQNFLLAARAMGLGSVITTLHKRYEDEIKEMLGIPGDVETAALLPLGYPAEGERYGPTRRTPARDLLHWDRWGGGQ